MYILFSAYDKLLYRFVRTSFLKWFLSLFFKDLIVSWKKTNFSNDKFLDENADQINNICFSHSFSVEHLEELRNLPEFQKITYTNLEIFKFIHKELNLRSVRIGIRWNKVDFEGNINISYYKDYILYCLKNNIDICLNIGPIKTFRWPEVYIPDYIIRQSGISTINHEIPAKGLLFEQAKAYLTKLFQALKAEFGDDFFDKIKCVQTDNELFNPFGEKQWTPSIDFEAEMVKIVRQYFSKSKILISYSGGPNLHNIFNPEVFKVLNLIKRLRNSMTEKDFVIGSNYYYKVPGFPELSNGLMIDNFSFLKLLNGKNIFNKIISLNQQNHTDLEVSELQFEPWGEVTTPGSSLSEFQFTLLRVCEDLKSAHLSSLLQIRLWGSELYALRLLTNPSDEILQIKDLILRIQNKLEIEK